MLVVLLHLIFAWQLDALGGSENRLDVKLQWDFHVVVSIFESVF